MVEFINTDSELTKDSGRKGGRLASIQYAVKEKGKIHPDLVNDGEIEGLILSHSDYEQILEDNERFPSKKLTQGVKSGVTNRYDVEFGFKIQGNSDKFMVIPNTDDFSDAMKTAQELLDEQ